VFTGPFSASIRKSMETDTPPTHFMARFVLYLNLKFNVPSEKFDTTNAHDQRSFFIESRGVIQPFQTVHTPEFKGIGVSLFYKV
jgi:hypothetical protein